MTEQERDECRLLSRKLGLDVLSEDPYYGRDSRASLRREQRRLGGPHAQPRSGPRSIGSSAPLRPTTDHVSKKPGNVRPSTHLNPNHGLGTPSGIVNSHGSPTDYDIGARKAVEAFFNKEQGRVSRALQSAMTPISKATEVAMTKTPLGNVTEGIIALVNDGASKTVQHEAIVEDFNAAGHRVGSLEDIHLLSLQDVESVTGSLDSKYIAAMGAEGAALGAAGTFGPWWAAGAISADLLATVGLALRAVAEYGAYYGFPVVNQLEREYALRVLHAAALPGGQEKRAAFAELSVVGTLAAKKKGWEQLNKHHSTQVIKKLAERLNIRLTQAKLATFVPVAGAAVGATFNSAYGHRVVTTASHTYRGRALRQRFGDDFV